MADRELSTVEGESPAAAGSRRRVERMSPGARLGVIITGLLTLTWFFVSWIVMDSPLTDAVGETAGGLTAGLLVVSMVGAARR
jgi:hypothetical protein